MPAAANCRNWSWSQPAARSGEHQRLLARPAAVHRHSSRSSRNTPKSRTVRCAVVFVSFSAPGDTARSTSNVRSRKSHHVNASASCGAGPSTPAPRSASVEMVCLDELVPGDDRYRRLDELVDWSFVREAAGRYYADDVGRPSIDPIVLVKC